ncbi:MAG: NAD(P)/FAD-dependent oxidoreductase [Agathobacter sp.]|nr:NAD(P)/FAD-dependent oxidoreductase [Agathobacter sp.]
MGKNTKKQWDLVVIGAGASGMMAAITAARANKKVCIIEKLDKAGKKLLATGNGKCNYTNAVMHTDCFHGEKDFISFVLKQFSTEDCLDFFHSIGIYPKNKNGYYYPNSEQAASVVNALLYELERLEVKICYETVIKDIVPFENEVCMETNKGNIYGQHVIIATGLLAAPKLGSDGSLFDVIKSLGHRFKPILPALCGFYCKGMKFKQISGVRAQGSVGAYIDGEKYAEDTGEIQFTDYGLSGIPVFQISHYLSKGLYEKRKVEIKVNLLPDFDKKQLVEELDYRCRIGASMPVNTLLNGLVNQKLADMIFDKAGVETDLYQSCLSESQLLKIAGLLQDITVTVTNYRDYEFAQVCTGGIPLMDVDYHTLASKLVPNIQFTGEILDVDGICGGYNLHFAWATGYIAGRSI